MLPTKLFRDVKKIGIVGLGKTNKALIPQVRALCPAVKLTLRSERAVPDTEDFGFSRKYFGKDAYRDIDEDMLIFSPSVRRDVPELISARDRGVRFTSDTELFFDSFKLPTLAITGSDGKSTVTFLTAELTKDALGSPPSSNFGLPLCELVKTEGLRGAVVELSSFQLQYIKPKTRRAIITNITENHLNWHKDFDEYRRAKENILENTEDRVFCLADGISDALIGRYPAPFAVVSDKMDAPELLSLYGCQHAVTLDGGEIALDGRKIISLDSLLRKEDYNVRNIMCAIALSVDFCDTDRMISTLSEFRGLSHRAEYVGTHRGVRYINSSIDTTPERCARTLRSLGVPSHVIITGRGKGLSYAPLTEALSLFAKSVTLLGECRDTLYEILTKDKVSYPVFTADTLEDAVEHLASISDIGDTVLLSPAHTSYDAYTSFEERGEHFKKIVCTL